MTIVNQSYPKTSWRRFKSSVFRLLTLAALFFVVAPALWLVLGVVIRAVPHWKWNVLTTLSQGTSGGLENAVVGTLVIMFGVLLIAGSVGVLTGIHLAELAPTRRNGKPSGGFFRLAVDVLSGFPSIVLGYAGYVALCVELHWGFSLLPALLILSLMVVPYISKSTESALRQVPTAYREGAEALGMPTGYALRKVVLKSALPGIVTGLLIALAVAGGETAPLLYTAGATNSLPTWSLLHHPVAYLTYYVWTDYNQPSAEAHIVSYDAALILVVMVLTLLVVARIIVSRTQRHSESYR
ncbi:MAG TPA: PstA family ABC transporter permease [Acidimicrobiales bacterium]|nr:PstA family ABC transporter permease [Acidimicrobiales bacterium]